MELTSLHVRRYRSLRDFRIEFGPMTLLIGANAAGKSNVLDALRFVADGVVDKDFRRSLNMRGGALHLAWKGQQADEVELVVELAESGRPKFDWEIRVGQDGVRERLRDIPSNKQLLSADFGNVMVYLPAPKPLDLSSSTGCALAAAATDPEFPARDVVDFIRSWTFFDFEPQQMRRASLAGYGGGDELEAFGRNLAQRLYALENGDATARSIFARVVDNTRAILGLPEKLETRMNPDDGRYYFVQSEPGLNFPVSQMAVSSGTLRVLALMTALFGESASIVGIEEPENYIHPRALADLAGLLKEAESTVQILITTHSPILLNAVDDPMAVRVISRKPGEGSQVAAGKKPEEIKSFLESSGFGLGDYFDASGFGA